MASQGADLDRDLFLNLGRVQNLSLDLSEGLPGPNPIVIVDDPLEEESGSEDSSQAKKVMRPTLKAKPEAAPHELGNPVTAYSPNHPRAVFLEDLKLGNAIWKCSCDGVG